MNINNVVERNYVFKKIEDVNSEVVELYYDRITNEITNEDEDVLLNIFEFITPNQLFLFKHNMTDEIYINKNYIVYLYYGLHINLYYYRDDEIFTDGNGNLMDPTDYLTIDELEAVLNANISTTIYHRDEAIYRRDCIIEIYFADISDYY